MTLLRLVSYVLVACLVVSVFIGLLTYSLHYVRTFVEPGSPEYAALETGTDVFAVLVLFSGAIGIVAGLIYLEDKYGA